MTRKLCKTLVQFLVINYSYNALSTYILPLIHLQRCALFHPYLDKYNIFFSLYTCDLHDAQYIIVPILPICNTVSVSFAIPKRNHIFRSFWVLCWYLLTFDRIKWKQVYSLTFSSALSAFSLVNSWMFSLLLQFCFVMIWVFLQESSRVF